MIGMYLFLAIATWFFLSAVTSIIADLWSLLVDYLRGPQIEPWDAALVHIKEAYRQIEDHGGAA